MLAPDTVLQGRYRIKGQLGQGGMGAVYEAIDERLDTVVALKETLFADERLRKQFEREARLLARMHHPALPRVSDHFAEGEGQFLVMQYIAGDDLDQMMKAKQGPFPADQVLTWGDQLLDALDYLHTQDPQIIHRDIKPQNLKITSRGQIILLDFGLAKGQSGNVSVVTTSASIFGYTPNYAPLEQIQGLGTDERSDIYALSATLYHLMTAVKPPDALTRAAALVNGQPDPLVPANAISASIGSEVATVLARGMSQNRDQRFATAAGMRAALQGSTEVATLAGRAEAATVILPPQASSGTVSTASEEAPTVLRSGETTVVQSPEPGKRGVPSWVIAAGVVVLIGAVVGGYFALQRRNNSAVATPAATVQESPPVTQPTQAVTSIASEPSTNATSNDTKKVESTGQQPESARKQTESSGKSTQKGTGTTQSSAPAIPAPPRVSTPEDTTLLETPDEEPAGTGNSEGRGRQTDVRTRTLLDGSKIITTPDGRRILVMPDGTRRVLRPAVRRRNVP